ncbi:MAG: glycosyltransferase family 2 protein [Deltaproteobacteria bacterium]|nr:glycosyltransferase family 2 protein [Deltaproteobacteria bacterium]MBW2658808.1 glycosyltransferase family 2 protein [Deltaproteobacteria bacterium]
MIQKSEQDPTVSVIVPTLNGAETLPDFFSALYRQDLRPVEILVADSSSTDRTVAICIENGAKVLSIPGAEFDHGGTRSSLAKQAAGDILVFFTQDAILAGDNALRLLVDPLLSDEICAGSYGRQLPSANASWNAGFLREFNYPEESFRQTFADRARLGLKTIFTSNSFAAYKKSILFEVGCFRNGLIFGEDTCTVGRILEAGYTIAYVGEGAVYHSHNYSFREEFRRSFDTGVLHSSEEWLLHTFGKAEGIGLKFFKSGLKRLRKEHRYPLMIEFTVRTGMKFAGYKFGRQFKYLPSPMRPLLSMNRTWWQKNS